MKNALCQTHCLCQTGQCRVGVAQQPLNMAAYHPGTHTRVVPTVEVTVRLIPFRIVTPASDFAVLATSDRLAGNKVGGPNSVVGLQVQSWICVFMRGHRQKPFRQWTRRENTTRADIVLIDSVNRLEKATLIAVCFGELAGPAIGFSDCRRDHALGAERGHPQRQLQVGFERVAFGRVGQRPQQGKTTLQVRDRFDMGGANPAASFVRAWLASAYAVNGEAAGAATELAEARGLSSDDRYSGIARLTVVLPRAPKIHALAEPTYYAGLRKADMPEE